MRSALRVEFMNRLRQLARSLLGARCLLCGGAADGEFCADCDAELPAVPTPVCATCALPSPAGSMCAACLRDPPPWQRAVAGCAYAYPVDALVKALKYGGRLECAPALASVLAHSLSGSEMPDVVVPLPLSRRRLRDRGFNQSMEIARALPAALSSLVDPTTLHRPMDAGPQAALPLDARAANVRGAFLAVRPLAGQHIALVDDVMTTGATLREAARALHAAGARQISVWVVARTIPD